MGSLMSRCCGKPSRGQRARVDDLETGRAGGGGGGAVPPNAVARHRAGSLPDFGRPPLAARSRLGSLPLPQRSSAAAPPPQPGHGDQRADNGAARRGPASRQRGLSQADPATLPLLQRTVSVPDLDGLGEFALAHGEAQGNRIAALAQLVATVLEAHPPGQAAALVPDVMHWRLAASFMFAAGQSRLAVAEATLLIREILRKDTGDAALRQLVNLLYKLVQTGQRSEDRALLTRRLIAGAIAAAALEGAGVAALATALKPLFDHYQRLTSNNRVSDAFVEEFLVAAAAWPAGPRFDDLLDWLGRHVAHIATLYEDDISSARTRVGAPHAARIDHWLNDVKGASREPWDNNAPRATRPPWENNTPRAALPQGVEQRALYIDRHGGQRWALADKTLDGINVPRDLRDLVFSYLQVSGIVTALPAEPLRAGAGTEVQTGSRTGDGKGERGGEGDGAELADGALPQPRDSKALAGFAGRLDRKADEGSDPEFDFDCGFDLDMDAADARAAGGPGEGQGAEDVPMPAWGNAPAAGTRSGPAAGARPPGDERRGSR